MRLFLLIAVGLWLTAPYFADRVVGTGDSLWYHHLLADAVTQFRAGVFPVFVGQSEHSFNGAVYPLRAAPYYQYLAGLLDLLTGQSLGFLRLQHLTVAVAFIGGALAAYAALLSIAPRHRWPACLLAILYVSCPGVAGLAYSQDLYMSVMTLPWVPLAFAATVRSFDQAPRQPALLMLAASLAALWWAHSPIALWATLLCAATQGLRVALQARERRTWTDTGLTAAAFVLLAAYPIVSVLLLRTPGETIVPYVMDREGLLREVQAVFPAALLPLDPAKSLLTHLQVGYALWAVLALSLGALVWKRRAPAVALLTVAALFFTVLILPVPGVTRALWFSFPETLVGMTLYWPMQRLCILLAGIAIVGGEFWLGRLCPDPAGLFRWVVPALLGGVLWSAWEIDKLRSRADASAQSVERSALWSRPENIAIQRHTYGLFAKRPAYFNHGVVDARLENRLLDPATGALLASNYDLPPGAPSDWSTFDGVIDANPGILNLRPALTLRPGERYLLTFDFARPDTTGILQMEGKRFWREYVLPSSGEEKAFGVAPGAVKSLTLWTSGQGTETVSLRFIPTGDGPGARPSRYIPFARYRLTRVDPALLPVEVKALMPYEATVRAPVAALLETPRMFVPGYVATVDGAAVPVRKSPEGLVAFPVPAGTSAVVLRFAGPPGLRAVFWLSFLGWSATAGFAAWTSHRRLRARLQPTVIPTA